MAKQSRHELSRELRAQLERDQRVNLHRSRVDLLREADGFRLEGQVPDIAAKRIAANLARQLAGDAPVTDRLAVATESVGDDELGRRLCDQLGGEGVFAEYAIVLHDNWRSEPQQQPDSAEYSIEVEVNDGVVGLSGTVGSQTHRRLAEALCWWLPGCRRVDNRLEVQPQQEDSDDLITDAVRMVLEKDPLVDAGQLRAATAAGIVELSGFLTSPEAHRLAVRDAWVVPGVWDVYDRIEVGQAPG